MKKMLLLSLTSTLLAISSQALPSPYGMIGLTAGETLRIKVANPEVSSPTVVPPGPCRMALTFLDSSGNQLLPAVQFTLQAGKSAHFDVNGDKLFPPGTVNLPAQRAEVRPVVKLLPPGPPTDVAFPPGPCVSSVEVFDHANGQTLATIAVPPGPPIVPVAQPPGPNSMAWNWPRFEG